MTTQDDKFEILFKICLLMAIEKPYAVELARESGQNVRLFAHERNMKHIIGRQGQRARDLVCIAGHLGFILNINDDSLASATSEYKGAVDVQEVLDELLTAIVGYDVFSSAEKIYRSDKFVCGVPRALLSDRQLQVALDNVFYAASKTRGLGFGVHLIAE